MKKLIPTIATLALVVAACAGDDGDSTTTTVGGDEATTTEASEETTTTGGSQPVSLDRICIEDHGGLMGEVLCASYEANTLSAVDASPQMEDTFPVIHGEYACLFVPDQLLVFPALADPFAVGLEPVEDAAADLLGDYLRTVELGWYEITDGGDGVITDGTDLLAKASDIRAMGVLASPHYLLAPTQFWKYGPGGMAQPVEAGWEAIEKGSGEAGSVVVIDTGGIADSERPQGAPALGIATPSASAPAIDEPASPPFPDHLRGHGQFIASIINQYNANLTVKMVTAGNDEGLVEEMSVVAAYDDSVTANDVVNLSLGTYPCSTEGFGLLEPVGLTVGTALMPHEIDGAISASEDDAPITATGVVAASGNDGEDMEAMYPARLGFGSSDLTNLLEMMLQDGTKTLDSGLDTQILLTFAGNLVDRVTAVGSVHRPEKPQGGGKAQWPGEADWSNQAEFYVPGEDVVGWYTPSGSLAVWSGTSFAAPRYAACLASGDC